MKLPTGSKDHVLSPLVVFKIMGRSDPLYVEFVPVSYLMRKPGATFWPYLQNFENSFQAMKYLMIRNGKPVSILESEVSRLKHSITEQSNKIQGYISQIHSLELQLGKFSFPVFFFFFFSSSYQTKSTNNRKEKEKGNICSTTTTTTTTTTSSSTTSTSSTNLCTTSRCLCSTTTATTTTTTTTTYLCCTSS